MTDVYIPQEWLSLEKTTSALSKQRELLTSEELQKRINFAEEYMHRRQAIYYTSPIREFDEKIAQIITGEIHVGS